MVTLDQISVALEHPLVLLIIGALISGVLVAWITNRWQDHKKKIEIKVEIVSKMSEFTADALGNAKTTIMRSKEEFSDAEAEKVLEKIEKWFGEVNIIRSKLQSYYGDTDLAKTWFSYWDVVLQYYLATINYFLKAPEPVKAPVPMKALEDQFKIISDYFSQNVKGEFLDKDKKPQKPWENLPMRYEETQWNNVNQAIMVVSDDIIKDVLKLPIKVF
jgi:hypothetical protein